MNRNDTTLAPAATQPEAIGLALDVLREMLSDPDQRLDQCPARMTRANQAARALAGVQAAPAAQEAEPATAAAVLSMVIDDVDTCIGEMGADYDFRDLSTETLEAIAAYRAAPPCRHGAAPAAQEAEPAVLPIAAKTHGAWDGLDLLDELPDGTELYAHPPRPQADGGAVPAGGLRRIGRIQHDSVGHPQAVLETAYDLFGNGWRPGTPIYSDEAAAPQAPAAAPNCQRCSGSGENPESYYDNGE